MTKKGEHMAANLYVFGQGHDKTKRDVSLGHVCLKIFNDAGDELSVSFDDSCGAFAHLQRVELCVFPKESKHRAVITDYRVDPELLLRRLAEHLDYDLTKKGE